jgi:hypothetical protein
MALHQGFTLGIYPRRITITINHQLSEHLLKRADYEGRSLSNLCAFLLENAMEDDPTHSGRVDA